MEIDYLFLRCRNCPHDRGTRPVAKYARQDMDAVDVASGFAVRKPAQILVGLTLVEGD
jgi:hypothetical protein